ncbi:MAG: hypothetical protein ACOCYZ_02145 [Halococcoides sp.]
MDTDTLAMSIVAAMWALLALLQGVLIVDWSLDGDSLVVLAEHVVQLSGYLVLAVVVWLSPRSDRIWDDDAWTRGRRLALPTVAVILWMYVVRYTLDPGPIVLSAVIVFGAVLAGLLGWTVIDQRRAG